MPRQLSASDLSRVRLSLQQSGISQQGIQQILSSQPIMNPLDRQAMLSILSSLITGVGFPALDAGSKDPAQMSINLDNIHRFRR
jgi:hypothetical protein